MENPIRTGRDWSIAVAKTILLLGTICFSVDANVIQLGSGNIDDVFASNELVFVNFYADWCHFSQMLTPIYEQTSKKVLEEFPEPGRIALAKVDCDREGAISARYQVNKYPTLKMFRFGQPIKKEYRGQRSPEAIAEFIRLQLKEPLIAMSSSEQLAATVDPKKRNIIGSFDSEDSDDYKLVFKKVASHLRDDCVFYAITGSPPETGNKIVYREPRTDVLSEETYGGATSDYQAVLDWAINKCVPLVKEITFENAEELTEEGLPFMILFHNPEDMDTPQRYKELVSLELLDDRSTIKFLTADGLKFTHPLHHLGKSANDLPVLVIDSFRHMFLWPRDPRADIDKPGLVKQFIADLHSGKLHREFHQGPDPTPPSLPPGQQEVKVPHIPKNADEAHPAAPSAGTAARTPTSPPESLFRKLLPSRTRYTILRDEL